MKTLTTFFSVLPILVLAAACSSSSSDTASSSTAKPLSAAEEADLAGQVCDGYATPACDTPEEQVANRDSCLKEAGFCLARIATPAALTAFGQCLKTRTCAKNNLGNCDCGGKSDDDCYREVGQGLPASPVRDAYVAACQTKLAECGKGTGSFSDDWCTPGGLGFELYTEAVYEGLKPCFEKACGNGTIGNCLRGKLTELSGGACNFDD